MDPYKYSPIKGDQIRLIRLHPARDAQQPLQGELVTVGLDEVPPPLPPNSPDFSKPVPEGYICYEAISYVWGAGGFDDELLTSEGTIAITPSLSSILKRLRDTNAPRILWADALCINQKDVAEKEVQVALMGTIYSSAVRVICDLGEEYAEGHAVLDAMSRYWRKNIRRGMVIAEQSGAIMKAEFIAPTLGLTIPTEEEAAALQDLPEGTLAEEFQAFTSLPWFTRVWVIQEFVLGREVIMLFGTRQVAWGELYAGMMTYPGVTWPWAGSNAGLDENFLINSRLSYLSMCMIHAGRIVDLTTPHGKAFDAIVQHLASTTKLSQTFSLPLFLLAFCFSKVTMPRDRYFAVLGLLHDADVSKEPALRPDYTSPMEDITRRYWRWGLQQRSGADLLQSAGIAGCTGAYPTWIRDITVDSWLDHVWVLGAAADASHRAGGVDDWAVYFDDSDPDRMSLRAYYLDSISEMMPTIGPAFEFAEMIRRFEDVAQFFIRKGEGAAGAQTVDCVSDMRYPHTGEHVHEAALKTLCNYSTNDENLPLDQSLAAYLRKGLILPLLDLNTEEGFSDAVQKQAEILIEDQAQLTHMLIRVCSTWRLRMIKTKRGFFACMPPEAREGDSVWIVPGSRLPFLFRPSETHPGSYQVIGRGYVHGVMNGEAMSMPEFAWRMVSLR